MGNESSRQTSRAMIQQALAAAGAGTFVAYPDQGIMRCSRAVLTMLGLPEENSIIQLADWLGSVQVEARAEVSAKIRRCIEQVEDHTVDYPVVLQSGRTLWVRAHARPVRDNSGHTIVYGALLDITQIKSLELDVLGRDARLREVSVAARFYMWELNLETMEYKVDRPVPGSDGLARNATYISSVELAESLHHPEDRHLLRTMIIRVRQGNVPYEVEARVMHPDGTYHWMLAQGKLANGPGPRRVLGIIQDIDKRKTAALRLEAVESRLKRVMRGTNDGMWEIQCLSGQLWIAPRTAAMLEYETSDLGTPQLLMELVHPDDRALVAPIFFHRSVSEDHLDIEVRLRNKAGDYRLMRLRGFCERDSAGSPLTLSGSLQDITEHRAYQQALINATQAADAASKAKSDFLANMSHEIRTPMNGVLGMTELLLTTALSDEQREFAQTAHESATALLTVINDILDFSKIEAGKLAIEMIDMNLRETVDHAMRLLAIQAQAKQITLSVRVDPTIPDRLKGDAGRLRQILLNLGGNAVKFTNLGDVAITATAIQAIAAGCLVRFEIRDSGLGIPADRIDALFQPFSQVDPSTTRRFGGTGLGLSIVRRLVNLMGGEVGVSSIEGMGSTFWFTIPFEYASQMGAHEVASISNTDQPPSLRPSMRAARILLAEDNAVNQKVAGRVLQRLGHHVDIVSDGRAAVNAWVGGRYDLILMDCQMPELDGYEATREIRRRENAPSHTPIIALTAHAVTGAAEECYAAGMDAHLTKPIDRAQLQACIERFFAPSKPPQHCREASGS